jgi:hypothetical protein
MEVTLYAKSHNIFASRKIELYQTGILSSDQKIYPIEYNSTFSSFNWIYNAFYPNKTRKVIPDFIVRPKLYCYKDLKWKRAKIIYLL